MEISGDKKLKKVLTKLLDPNFKLKSESYLNSLIDHLKGNLGNTIETEDTLPLDFFVLWLKQALVQWEQSKQCPNITVLSFTINLTTLQSAREEVFVKLNSENIFEKFIKVIFRVIGETNSPTIKLGYIRLLTSFLNHKSGLQWILSTNYWSKVLVLTLKCQTVYLQKEGCQFLAQLLHKSVVINETFCINVVQIILSPIIEVSKSTDIREQAVYQKLCPCLNVVIQTFEVLLELSTSSSDYQVFLIFRDKFHLENIVRAILSKIEIDDFVFELNKLLFCLSFFNLVHKVGGKFKALELDKAMQASQNVFDVFMEAANRGTVTNFLKLCYMGHIYWRNIKSIMPQCLSKEKMPLLFEDQLLMLQLYPAVMISLRMVGNNFEDLEAGDACREDLVNQLCKNIIPETFRAVYKWRTYLHNNFSFDHATLALKYVLHSKQFYDKRMANTAFRILIHSLRDINRILREQPEQVMVLARESNYICLLIETVGVLIKEFELKWQDSLETICVMEVIFNVLSVPVWPTKLVVKGLSLLEISIANRMSPTQALLIDSTKESTFTPITTMLYAKLHDSSWEVRDTAMEVVRTICDLANREFPSFKICVLDTGLSTLTLKMAIGDGEPFVRASAFKCLQKMVVVDEFWQEVTKSNDSINQIINVLHQESEGIVRCEAAALVSKIYIHQQVSSEVLEKFYSVMSHAVIVDLHWEVKIKALDFWYTVIEKHLTHQGMIDGSFPTVTFSKEQKKIVTLDEQEVRKRLIKVLHQLSSTGCLGVFIFALQDDCDIEVSKVALNLIKNFVALIKQYKVTLLELNTPPLTPSIHSNSYSSPVPSSPSNFSTIGTEESMFNINSIPPLTPSSVNETTEAARDCIMEDILNSQDLNLLENVFNALDEPFANAVAIVDKKIMSPFEFLSFVFDELDKMDDKSRWLKDMDNFDSLLDDILSEYDGDINSMDCY